MANLPPRRARQPGGGSRSLATCQQSTLFVRGLARLTLGEFALLFSDSEFRTPEFSGLSGLQLRVRYADVGPFHVAAAAGSSRHFLSSP
jgi:hypothetical protein